MDTDGPVTRDQVVFRTGLALRTYAARAATKALPLPHLRRVERTAFGRLALRRGAYRIPFGPSRGLLLDAGTLELSSAQARSVLRGLHEPQVCEALRRHLAPGGTFVDVGAHIGYATILGARLVGPEGSVVAVEPVPENVAAIRRNVALNGLAQVRVVAAAAGACTETRSFISTEDSIWSRVATVGAHPFEAGRFDVRGVTIDELVDRGEIGAPDVVKIDVEGAELEVLEGMRGQLEERPPVIICEMHGRNAQFVAFLDRYGYRVTNLDGTEPIATAGVNEHALAVRSE